PVVAVLPERDAVERSVVRGGIARALRSGAEVDRAAAGVDQRHAVLRVRLQPHGSRDSEALGDEDVGPAEGQVQLLRADQAGGPGADRDVGPSVEAFDGRPAYLPA